jgi:DNA-binding NtrC family response regulator
MRWASGLEVNPMGRTLLLIDDDESFREVMRFHLSEEGYEIDVASDGQQGLRSFQEKLHPVVVTDLKMPQMDGLTVLEEIRKRSPTAAVIVITAFGEIDTAVRAMKAGAFDFIPKPTSREHFKLVVKRAFEHVQLKARVRELEDREPSASGEVIYRSADMEQVVALADRVAASDSTVLLRGESGTGKEVLARRIHLKSLRAGGPFVPLNCAALPKDLLESELFGHVKGAFTGATRDHLGKFRQADAGTIFLDEIGELPAELQPRLLRVLQERTVDVVGGEGAVDVDVRVVAATNRDLAEAVADGVFREDLFFRLNVVPIDIPPLRERKEDIPLLAAYFIKRHARGRSLKLTKKLFDALEAHSWPGNVRELQNICQRIVLLADGQELGVEQLTELSRLAPDEQRDAGQVSEDTGITFTIPPQGMALEQIERQIISAALERNDYNQSKTARFLRIPRHILLYRLDKYRIPVGR